jgi:superoxide dismutase
MKQGGGGQPAPGRLLDMINKDFGSFDAFRKEFANAANTAFGSGWAWLVQTPAGLKVRAGSNITKHVRRIVYMRIFSDTDHLARASCELIRLLSTN